MICIYIIYGYVQYYNNNTAHRSNIIIIQCIYESCSARAIYYITNITIRCSLIKIEMFFFSNTFILLLLYYIYYNVLRMGSVSQTQFVFMAAMWLYITIYPNTIYTTLITLYVLYIFGVIGWFLYKMFRVWARYAYSQYFSIQCRCIILCRCTRSFFTIMEFFFFF